jgi:hypothetical protein
MAVAHRVLVIAYQAAQTDLSEVRRAPDSPNVINNFGF